MGGIYLDVEVSGEQIQEGDSLEGNEPPHKCHDYLILSSHFLYKLEFIELNSCK